MSHKSGAVNFLIQDASGQPQVIKVVQNTPTKASGSQILTSTPVKTMFKVPGTPDSSQGSVYRTVKVTGIKSGSKIVQVPIQTLTHLQKTMAESQDPSPSGQQKKMQAAAASTSNVRVIQPVPTTSLGGSSSRHAAAGPSLSHGKRYAAAPPPHTRKRDHEGPPPPEYTSKRRKAADKIGKGLRHFSLKVCDKVRAKGFTSYNEVADELVAEFAAGMHGSPDAQQYDQKNIRRRVYDALNVLMAMNIISKDKKEIRWIGLPTNSLQEYAALERDKQTKTERILQKTQQLQDLLLQQISFKALVERNRAAESRGMQPPSTNSAINLPFIVVNTSDKGIINCSISNDKTEYMFHFDKKFQIYDDIDILKRMGLLLGVDKGECTEENLNIAKNMVPKSLSHYVERMGRGDPIQLSDMVHTGFSDEEEEAETLDDTEEADWEEEVLEDEDDTEDAADVGAETSTDEDSGSDVDVN